jgi:hypothetical protein
MKKNDAMGYVAYLLMLVIAVVVGFAIIRPIFSSSTYAGTQPMPGVLLVFLALLVGIVFNAIILELGHLVGAAIGKYEVRSCAILGVQFKKKENGKTKVGFASFDGITGETVIVPKDAKKSNPAHTIYMPMFFLLAEVVALVVFMVFCQTRVAQAEYVWEWWYVFSLVVLTVGGMIFLYDIFPAPLDSKNDGYLLTILTNPTNKEAYNQMLLAQDRLSKGLPSGDTPVYDSVTDFTSKINEITLYQKLGAKDYEGALAIIEKTLACKNKVSDGVYHKAQAQKTAIILLTKPLEESKQYFIDLPLEEKKYIASLNNAPSVRAYLLASGLVEESLSESEAALNKADSAIHRSGEYKKVEQGLLQDAVAKVLSSHKDWDLSSYNAVLGIKEEEKPADESNKDAK